MFGHAKKCCVIQMFYSWQYDILALNVRFLKKMTYFNFKCHFVYMMNMQKYERTFVLKK